MLRCAILTTLIHLVQVRNQSHIILLQFFPDDKTVCGCITCRTCGIKYCFSTHCMPPYLLHPLLHLKEDVVGPAESKRSAPRTVSVQEQT